MKLTFCTTLLLCLGSIYSTLAVESATDNVTAEAGFRAPVQTSEKVTATDLERSSQQAKLEEKVEPEQRSNPTAKDDQERSKAPNPGYKNVQPASYGYAQPSYGYSRPSSYGYSQPSYGYSKPSSYSYSQPSYGYSRPSSYGYSQPSYGYSRPSSYSYSQPSYGYSKPSSYSYSQPSYGYSRPSSYGYSRPSYGHSRPTSYSYSQPSSYGYSQPSYGYSRPTSYSYSQPSYNYAKPSYSVPVSYAPKPVYPAPKPAPVVVHAPAPIVIPVPKPVIIHGAPSHGGSVHGGLGLGGLGLGGYGLGDKSPLGGGYGLGGLGYGKLGVGGGLGYGLGSKIPLAGYGSSPSLVIAPVAPSYGSGKCPTIGLLKYREAQLQDAVQTSKRSCGSSYKNDEYLDQWDADDDENTGDLDFFDRSLFAENSMELALLDPTALVEFDDSKRSGSGLCSNFRIILKTLRLIRRILKVLFSSDHCPPIHKLLRDFGGSRHVKKRAIPDYDYLDAFNNNNFNFNQQKHNSDLAGPENFKFGMGGPSPFMPFQQPYGPNLFQQQNSYPGLYPDQYLGYGKPAKKPVVVVAPVSKPHGSGKCKAQDYLKARRDQLSGILKNSRPKTCLLHSKDERSIASDEMSVSSFQELALLDPFSRVELVESDGRKRNEICSNPRIILKTLSILGKLIRFLFTTDPCPPIQHLSSWIMHKLDTRSLSSSMMRR